MTDPVTGAGAPGWRAAARRRVRRVHKRLGDDPRWLPIVLRATPLGTARRLSDRTELVIEGFPRSGNTFALFAFLDAQTRPVEVSSHVHVPSQVRLAVRRALPTVVTMRRPRPTVVSLAIAAPHLGLAAALAEYAHHHEELALVRAGVEVATFDEVTTDLGSVIGRVNARWATTFDRYDHSTEADARVFAAIDTHHRELHGGTEHVVPRPSEARRAAAERLDERLQAADLADALARAEASYEALLAG